jgi:hypothetical protein
MSTPVEVDALQAVKDLIAERDRLRRQVAEQQEELERLRREAEEVARERARLIAERDAYRRDACALLARDSVPFTADDVAEWQRTGIPLEGFIHEIENIMAVGPTDTPVLVSTQTSRLTTNAP